MDSRRAPAGIEITVGPHNAREGWAVLRVTYARTPEHEARVARAFDALLGLPTLDKGQVTDALSVDRADPAGGQE